MLKNIVILPVGSYEYHGALLPSNTDAVVAERVATDLSKQYKGSTLLPILNYGISTEHSDFAGTVTVRSAAYLDFMFQLLESLGAAGNFIVIINGHGGNFNILGAVESEFNYLHDKAKVFVPPIYSNAAKELSEKLLGEFDTHAGSAEASLMSFYGHTDQTELMLEDPEYIKKMSGSLRFFRTGELNKTGVIKDTAILNMSAKHGEQLHKTMVAELKKSIDSTLKDINRVLAS